MIVRGNVSALSSLAKDAFYDSAHWPQVLW